MKRLLQLLALAVLILLVVLLYNTLTLPQADSRVVELPELQQVMDEDAPHPAGSAGCLRWLP